MTDFVSLDVDAIEAKLRTGLIVRKVLLYRSTSSTSDVAWEYAQNSKNNGLCVFAEQQNTGRGRRGNKWLSSPGQSILCSILLVDFDCEGELLTLAAAVGCAEAIDKYTPAGARIKWPNDIIVDNRKIAGILLESRPTRKAGDYVIGIGINCHQTDEFFANADLDMPATSIDLASGSVVDRNLLAAELLNSLDRWLTTARTDIDSVIGRWKQLSTLLGHHVVVEYDQKRFAGHCIGVDPAKGLTLQLENGGVRMFDASHTTILKQAMNS